MYVILDKEIKIFQPDYIFIPYFISVLKHYSTIATITEDQTHSYLCLTFFFWWNF